MLAAPACRLQRLRREHQEAAGEERDHREHVQIHAVGSRRVAARLLQRLDGGNVRARWKHRADCLQDGAPVGAARKVHVEAVELAQAIEAPLRRRDVGQRGESPQIRDSGDLERHGARPDDQPDRCFAEALGSKRREQHLVGREKLYLALAQGVDADHAQRALRAGDADVELEARVHPRHAWKAGDLRIERLGKAAAPAAHLQVGFAGHRAHGSSEVFHGGPVQQVDAVAERHAERDAED
jgi:hypothetical protein